MDGGISGMFAMTENFLNILSLKTVTAIQEFSSYLTGNCCISITKTNTLILSREIVAVYSKNYMQIHKYTLWARCQVFEC
jgi:hypothetical protein